LFYRTYRSTAFDDNQCARGFAKCNVECPSRIRKIERNINPVAVPRAKCRLAESQCVAAGDLILPIGAMRFPYAHGLPSWGLDIMTSGPKRG
jgi:hypothetical protein